MFTTYKGYEVHRNRNRLDKKFYAHPINDLTTCRRIVIDTSTDLRAAIDEATQTRSLDSWELLRQLA